MSPSMKQQEWVSSITTVLLDIDDTLYPPSCGFSGHRNGEVVAQFMAEHLGFPNASSALALRDEYFRKYHSTLKGLAVADQEGRLPKPFVEADLGQYWATRCDFNRFLTPNAQFVADLEELKKTVVAFTNAPRAYGLRCLEILGLNRRVDYVFGVEDVMPSCKPERAAFETVLAACGARPQECVMLEDSMKNIRACHALGIRTVYVREDVELATSSEAALLGDVGEADDPAVDVVISSCGQLRAALPGLWEN